MVTIQKILLGNDDHTYEAKFIHPANEEEVFGGDGFEGIDDVATFMSDLHAAITDTYMPPEDMKEKIKVLEDGSYTDRTFEEEPAVDASK